MALFGLCVFFFFVPQFDNKAHDWHFHLFFAQNSSFRWFEEPVRRVNILSFTVKVKLIYNPIRHLAKSFYEYNCATYGRCFVISQSPLWVFLDGQKNVPECILEEGPDPEVTCYHKKHLDAMDCAGPFFIFLPFFHFFHMTLNNDVVTWYIDVC